MNTSISKPVIFVVISVLVIAFVYSSYSRFEAFAEPKDPNFGSGHCVIHDDLRVTCCWKEPDLNNPGKEVRWCQTCNLDPTDCGPLFSSTGPFAPPQDGILDEPPTPPSGPAAPLQEGGVLQQPPTQGVSPPVTRGQGVLPQDGVLQQQQPTDQGAAELSPPATEETQPATVEEEQPVPVCQEGLEFNEDLGFCVPEDCPEGQVLDEESGICVLEEPEAAEQEPAQSEPEEEQSSEESDQGDDSNN